MLKTQKHIYLRNGAILTKSLTHRASSGCTDNLSPKLLSSHVWGPSLISVLNAKNVCISKTEQDRAISMKFLTHRVSAESTDDIFKTCFPTTFGGHLEFLH